MVPKTIRNTLKQLTLSVCSLILVGCSSAPKRVETPNNGWLKVEAGTFSIYAPPGWEFHQKQGIDSYVGQFTGSGVVLKFDYGQYSNPLDEAVEPKYVVAQETIGSYRAKVVCPRMPGHGVTGVYFPRIGSSDKLCLWGQDLTGTTVPRSSPDLSRNRTSAVSAFAQNFTFPIDAALIRQ